MNVINYPSNNILFVRFYDKKYRAKKDFIRGFKNN